MEYSDHISDSDPILDSMHWPHNLSHVTTNLRRVTTSNKVTIVQKGENIPGFIPTLKYYRYLHRKPA